jgi:hypothetical protein
MIKIRNIIEGWINRFRKLHPAKQQLFDDRLKVCEPCEMLKAGICTACGCVVKAKTKSVDEECPENKWLPIMYEQNGIRFIDIDEIPAPYTFREFGKWHKPNYIPEITDCNAISWDDWLEFKEHLKGLKWRADAE